MKLQVKSSSQEMTNIGSSVPFVMNGCSGCDSGCGVDLIKPSMILGGATTTNGGVKYLFQSYQQQLEPTMMNNAQVSNNAANVVHSPSSQLPQSAAAAAAAFFMSNEEARRLKGLVAKTRALFEQQQQQPSHKQAVTKTPLPIPSSSSTITTTATFETKIRQSLSANNVSQFKLSRWSNGGGSQQSVTLSSTPPESSSSSSSRDDSDKENGHSSSGFFYRGVKLKSTGALLTNGNGAPAASRFNNSDNINHNNSSSSNNHSNSYYNYRSSYGEPEVIYSNNYNLANNIMQPARSATIYTSESMSVTNGEALVRPSFLKLKKQAQNKSSNILFDTCPGTNECRTFFRKQPTTTAVSNGNTIHTNKPIIDSATQTEFNNSTSRHNQHHHLRQRQPSPMKQQINSNENRMMNGNIETTTTAPFSKYLSQTQQPQQQQSNGCELWKKSEEISRELNIPLSVKQAKMCFETLALRAASNASKVPTSISNIDFTSSSNTNTPPQANVPSVVSHRPLSGNMNNLSRFIASTRAQQVPTTTTATTCHSAVLKPVNSNGQCKSSDSSTVSPNHQDEVNLLLSSSSSSSTSSSSSSSSNTHHSNIILSTASSSSPSETSSSSVVFNSHTSSSCETTPRSSAEVNIKTLNRINAPSSPTIHESTVINTITATKPTNVANKIRRLEEKFTAAATTTTSTTTPLVSSINKDSLHPDMAVNFQKTTFTPVTAPTLSSSFTSTANTQTQTQINITPVKYVQSPKFLQLYQKQMEIKSNTSYRKLEDIMNEAERSSTVVVTNANAQPSITFVKLVPEQVDTSSSSSSSSSSSEAVSSTSPQVAKFVNSSKDNVNVDDKKKQLKSILRKV